MSSVLIFSYRIESKTFVWVPTMLVRMYVCMHVCMYVVVRVCM